MIRRNTIQRDLVLNAVVNMHSHVTADDVYEYIHRDHPYVSRGTIYRNLKLLAEEQKITEIEIPNCPNYYDFTIPKHYHVRCVVCGMVSDIDMDLISDLTERIRDDHGFVFLNHDILFKGICGKCQKKGEQLNG